ncbi:MAG TPA: hypothetical protein VFC63_20875 [Blastocatellia bacterium]|nr:hypothetical protein [Blastocatellia bacterium]
MRARNLFESKPIVFDSVLELGNSHQSKVYALIQDANLVAKLLSRRSKEQSDKLTYMVDHLPAGIDDPDQEFSVAWPIDLLLRNGPDGPTVAGMIMPRATNSYQITSCYRAELRQQQFPEFSYRSLMRIARNLCGAVNVLHRNNIALGHIKESHILVSPGKRVTVVGADTLQLTDKNKHVIYKSAGNAIEFLPPELQGLTDCDFGPEQDHFGLAVLIFKLLMEGQHPFSAEGVAGDSSAILAKQICAGKFAFATGSRTVEQTAPSFGILSPEIQNLFVKCFVDGYKDPTVRPTADNWYKALDRFSASAKSCKINRQHTFGNHLKSCPWCEIAAAPSGVDLYTRVDRSQDEKDGGPTAPTTSKQTATGELSAAPKNRHVSTVLARSKPVKEKRERIKVKDAVASHGVVSQYDDGQGFILFGRYFEKRSVVKVALIVVLVLGFIYLGWSGLGGQTADRSPDASDPSVSGVVVSSVPGINVTVVSLRFFENSNPSARRLYFDRFKNDETTEIAWELGIDSTGSTAESFTVNALWYDPTGNLLTSQDLDCKLPTTPTITYYTLGYAKSRSGSWNAGKYTVELRAGGVLVARRSFDVY